MNGSYNESAYENAVIEVLKSTKWEYTYGPDIEDRDYQDPVLNDVFQYQLRRLNRDVPDDAIQSAFHKVKEIVSGSLVERNRIFTEYLQNGVEVTSNGPFTKRTTSGILSALPTKVNWFTTWKVLFWGFL